MPSAISRTNMQSRPLNRRHNKPQENWCEKPNNAVFLSGFDDTQRNWSEYRQSCYTTINQKYSVYICKFDLPKHGKNAYLHLKTPEMARKLLHLGKITLEGRSIAVFKYSKQQSRINEEIQIKIVDSKRPSRNDSPANFDEENYNIGNPIGASTPNIRRNVDSYLGFNHKNFINVNENRDSMMPSRTMSPTFSEKLDDPSILTGPCSYRATNAQSPKIQSNYEQDFNRQNSYKEINAYIKSADYTVTPKRHLDNDNTLNINSNNLINNLDIDDNDSNHIEINNNYSMNNTGTPSINETMCSQYTNSYPKIEQINTNTYETFENNFDNDTANFTNLNDFSQSSLVQNESQINNDTQTQSLNINDIGNDQALLLQYLHLQQEIANQLNIPNLDLFSNGAELKNQLINSAFTMAIQGHSWDRINLDLNVCIYKMLLELPKVKQSITAMHNDSLNSTLPLPEMTLNLDNNGNIFNGNSAVGVWNY